jgi:vitamin B12 transporter
MNSRIASLFAGAFAGASPLIAAQEASTLDPIVVTASRIEQPVHQVLGDITVIGRDTLERAGQGSLTETLVRTVPGLQYIDNGGPQSKTSLFIRGAESGHTLVLIDGIRVNNAEVGTAFLESFSPDMFDRVEVLRGASSSLYGADAIGGVVNVLTHRPQTSDQPISANASIGHGTHNTQRTRLGVRGAAAGWDYALAGGYGKSRGFNATNTDNAFSYNPDRDGYYQNSQLGTLGYTWAPGHRLGLLAYHTYLNGQYDSGPHFMTGAYFDDRARTKQAVYALSSSNRINDRWESILRAAYSGDEQRNNSSSGRSHFASEKHTYTWQNNVQLTPAQGASLILERLEERRSGSTTYALQDRQTNSAGGVYRFDLGRHHVQLNARNDHSSQYGDKTTGGVAYGFDITPALRVGMAGNTGFKAPTFQDLYYPGFSNPNLKPERSRNVEANLRYAGRTTHLGLVAYQNRIRDLIVTTGDLARPRDNVDRATISGVTLSGEQDFDTTTVRASVDLQRPINDQTNLQLPNRARQIWRLGVDHRLGALRLGSELYISSQRYGTGSAQTRPRLGGYTQVNALASYDINKNLQAHLRWNNIFDRQYTLVRGYETMGSNMFVNLSWRM